MDAAWTAIVTITVYVTDFAFVALIMWMINH